MESSPLRLGLILSITRLLGLLRVEDSDLVPFLESFGESVSSFLPLPCWLGFIFKVLLELVAEGDPARAPVGEVDDPVLSRGDCLRLVAPGRGVGGVEGITMINRGLRNRTVITGGALCAVRRDCCVRLSPS